MNPSFRSDNFILISDILIACILGREISRQMLNGIPSTKIQSRAGRPARSFDDISFFIKHNPDCTISDIVENTGYCRSTVSRVLKESDCKVKKCRTGPPMGNKALEIISYIESHPGYSYSQIANIFKVSRQYVYQLKKRSNNL